MLSSHHRLLIDMCAKGLRNQDFSKIKLWYQHIIDQTDQLVGLLEKEEESFVTAMNALKCGLFSLNSEITRFAALALLKVNEFINQQNESKDKKSHL